MAEFGPACLGRAGCGEGFMVGSRLGKARRGTVLFGRARVSRYGYVRSVKARRGAVGSDEGFMDWLGGVWFGYVWIG